MSVNDDHGSERPHPAYPVEELDSAATTLLASASSSKGHSLDKQRSYADIELERYDESLRKRRGSQDSAYASSEDRREDEDEHLLATGTAALNRSAQAADTIPDDGEPPPPPEKEPKKKPVKWRELPKKGQLAILTLARLSEPLTQTSLQSYMFYQLKSFKTADGKTPSDSTVASQAGLLAAAFTAAQFMTALMWGRLADWDGLGRKKVILIGLLGTTIGSLGFGFSESFTTAVIWRMIGGMLNGNIGVMRTMISEIVKEKKFQSRAFLLLPLTFNIGVIIGPLLGGLLADPVGSYPALFAPGGKFGGKDGVYLFMRWPYALPNLINATFLAASALTLFFGMDETLESLRDKPDFGRRFTKWVARTFFGTRPTQEYAAINEYDDSRDIELSAATNKEPKVQTRRKLPFRRIWTSNLLFTLLAHGLLAMHIGTFNNLWFVFLSTPRYDPHAASDSTLNLPSDYKPHLPFKFTGGLALSPPTIGLVLAILGVIGINLQLFLYPRLSFRLGTINAYRLSLLLFPFTYTLAPFLSVLPSSTAPPAQASGPLLWAGLTVVLTIQILGRTFALPSTAILVNNACPHPSVLGTMHGIAQSVSSATRTIGPALGGLVYGIGLRTGFVGIAWWGLAGVAVVAAFAGRWVREGDGHEIWLEGEREEEEERARNGRI